MVSCCEGLREKEREGERCWRSKASKVTDNSWVWSWCEDIQKWTDTKVPTMRFSLDILPTVLALDNTHRQVIFFLVQDRTWCTTCHVQIRTDEASVLEFCWTVSWGMIYNVKYLVYSQIHARMYMYVFANVQPSFATPWMCVCFINKGSKLSFCLIFPRIVWVGRITSANTSQSMSLRTLNLSLNYSRRFCACSIQATKGL